MNNARSSVAQHSRTGGPWVRPSRVACRAAPETTKLA